MAQPHRLFGQAGFQQRALGQLAGQVEAAAGLRRHNALRRGGSRRASGPERERGAGGTQGGQDEAHGFS